MAFCKAMAMVKQNVIQIKLTTYFRFTGGLRTIMSCWRITKQIPTFVLNKLPQKFSFDRTLCLISALILGWMRDDRRQSQGCSSPARLLSWWHFHGIYWLLLLTPSPSIFERLSKVSLNVLWLPLEISLPWQRPGRPLIYFFCLCYGFTSTHSCIRSV